MYHYLPKLYDGERYGGFHERQLPKNHKEYFVFTTIRDPFERLVAAWNSLLFQPDYRPIYIEKVGSDSFGDFVRWILEFDNQTKFHGRGSPVITLQSVWLKDVLDHIDHFVVTNDMNNSFAKLPFSTGTDVFEAKLKRNHSEFKNLAQELTGDEYDKLCEWLKPDINLYHHACLDNE